MKDGDDKKTLENLRKLVAQVEEDMFQCKPRYMDAFYFPDKSKKNMWRFIKWIQKAKKTLDICIFNFTNDDIAKAVKERHDAGVKVRIIADDESMNGKGNDVQALCDYGIEVRTDSAPEYHMHDKFVVVDHAFVMTGSFNWTFQAVNNNQENVLVVDHPYYCESYTKEYEKLWRQFDKN
jgi:phosphatidylserine/phosphatidylglycerophosphate/cardiolipin synthase-like enzyme